MTKLFSILYEITKCAQHFVDSGRRRREGFQVGEDHRK